MYICTNSSKGGHKMAQQMRKPMPKQPARPQNNAYKKGKLSKNARFSPRRIKWTPIIVLLCVIATFIFAIIFGNFLGKKAEQSQDTTTSANGVSNLTPPSADKVNPKNKLQAYFADLSVADPKKSLSELTADARNSGNAIFVNIKNENGEIIYSSDKADELGFEHQDNLTLSRLKNHFEYYDDFSVGFFKSDFSANLDEEKALKLQTNEILLLKEATDIVFNEIIVEFSGNITNSNLIYYQSYLLNLKVYCPKTPIGIKLSGSFINNSDNAGSVSGLLNIADFFVLNLENESADEIKATLSPLIYFIERYDCVVMLGNDDTLADKISALEDKGIENYIVK